MILGLREMGKEEWLLFRNKIVKLDEYLETWMQDLSASVNNELPIVGWLFSQVESYKVYTILFLSIVP